MAVQIESKQTYSTEQILAAFGIKDEVIAQIKAADLSIGITPSSLKVTQKGMPVASIPVKAGAALFALQGKLAGSSLESVAYKIMGVLKPLLDGVESPSMAAVKAAKHAKNYGASDEMVSKIVKDEDQLEAEDSAPPKKTLKEAIEAKKKPAFTKKAVEALKGKVVPLSMATELYQPVQGTGGGSVYITLALCPDLKVAARYKGHNLSIRAEGDVAKYHGRLEAAGFNKLQESYASVHLACNTAILARRAVASVLGGLDIEFSSPWPDFNKMQEGA